MAASVALISTLVFHYTDQLLPDKSLLRTQAWEKNTAASSSADTVSRAVLLSMAAKHLVTDARAAVARPAAVVARPAAVVARQAAVVARPAAVVARGR